MTLLELLTGVCLISTPLAAVWSARRLHAGFGGYVLAGFVGVVVGALFAWLMWAAVKALCQRWKRVANSEGAGMLIAFAVGRSLESASSCRWRVAGGSTPQGFAVGLGASDSTRNGKIVGMPTIQVIL
jgi:hypothetical protein